MKAIEMRVTSIEARERTLAFGGVEIRRGMGLSVDVAAESGDGASLTFQHYIEDRAQAIQVGDRLRVTVEHVQEGE